MILIETHEFEHPAMLIADEGIPSSSPKHREPKPATVVKKKRQIKPKNPLPEENDLMASIVDSETSYWKWEDMTEAGERIFQDETILTVFAEIQTIGRKHKHLIDTRFQMTFTCSRTWRGDETPPHGGTARQTVLFDKNSGCSAYADISADELEHISSRIDRGIYRRIALKYGRPHYGRAKLQSYFFGPKNLTLTEIDLRDIAASSAR